jgi:hypothetical protein
MSTRRATRVKGTGVAAAVAALAFIASTPASAAPAGPGEWDYIGSSSFYEVNGTYYSHEVKSSGGNFKACIETSTNGRELYGLFEADTNSSHEKIGSSRTQVAGGCETWDVSAYVDGDNNRAEVYVATTDSKAYNVRYYD